ncbi:MAG: GreA/GreB family elongation factor [Candidatus Nealsonbacteria bacterium]|nr:GreA/GreB family elongation factor [Candidatus Nealsonbacteria bacterium]
MEEGKIYLTKEGLEKTKKQYQDLWKIRKAKSADDIPQFLQSEEINPEYLSFQEDLNFLENKISELKYILKNFQLIEPPAKAKREVVNLGAQVWLESKNNQIDKFRIVGHLETNPFEGEISNESPLGQALLGHKTGEEIIVPLAVKTKYKIKKIEYRR